MNENIDEVEMRYVVTVNGETAICPKCVVDAILPYIVNTTLLADCCERWFTTGKMPSPQSKIEQEPELDTLQKLAILETEKCIYNIHYCNDGVGITFYYPEKDTGMLNKTLNCDQYYPTFEECIAGEFARFDGCPIQPEEGAFWPNYTVNNTNDVYEYMYVEAMTVKYLGKNATKAGDNGWQADGAVVIIQTGYETRMVQRMRRLFTQEE
ncbi:hypothetical protein MNBD_GAMMA08-10 [hydrothermal vent metagenome]|uniref:Uncharacterized protein n=1 Tax=hydrothermal vent metagenome TaxID=652676 RepID=A0A3B0XTY3_9ZZZZ